MKIRYKGDNAIQLLHGGFSYDLKPGDVFEADNLPDAPGFEEEKEKQAKGVKSDGDVQG